MIETQKYVNFASYLQKQSKMLRDDLEAEEQNIQLLEKVSKQMKLAIAGLKNIYRIGVDCSHNIRTTQQQEPHSRRLTEGFRMSPLQEKDRYLRGNSSRSPAQMSLTFRLSNTELKKELTARQELSKIIPFATARNHESSVKVSWTERKLHTQSPLLAKSAVSTDFSKPMKIPTISTGCFSGNSVSTRTLKNSRLQKREDLRSDQKSEDQTKLNRCFNKLTSLSRFAGKLELDSPLVDTQSPEFKQRERSCDYHDSESWIEEKLAPSMRRIENKSLSSSLEAEYGQDITYQRIKR